MRDDDQDFEQLDSFQDFLQELGDVKPINSDDKVHLQQTQQAIEKQMRREALLAQKPKESPLTFEGVKPVKPDDFLEFKQAGIQDGVYKNLRQGKYPIEQKISLAGLSLRDSSITLYQKINAAHERGVRTLLIHHGKGEQSQPFPALKKSYVNHWLPQFNNVIAFHTAQPMHGGLGATYVLLKKHPNQKMINREKQAKR
ncbi:DNA endonuclease SmrA [Alteromonas oceani]|uniref:DNA endonuclease SmrA n=1 Tax=Alteromonas oceani TaxID=2071609 RepID=A0ABV7K5F6_9ALTE|nr:DNA endonuclease SmrA [Alteromonas oceani]